MLRELDALVFDIQDVGVRFYTYESTMIYAMEEAAGRNCRFMCWTGPIRSPVCTSKGRCSTPKASFTGSFPLPLRHGMTIGELARLSTAKKHSMPIFMCGNDRLDAGEWFDETGLPWVNRRQYPQPDGGRAVSRSCAAGSSTNYSVGRGTDMPFGQIGAEWIRPRELRNALLSEIFPAFAFIPYDLPGVI